MAQSLMLPEWGLASSLDVPMEKGSEIVGPAESADLITKPRVSCLSCTLQDCQLVGKRPGEWK